MRSRPSRKDWLDAPDFDTARGRIVASMAPLVGALGTLVFAVFAANDVMVGNPRALLAIDVGQAASFALLGALGWSGRLPPARANFAVLALGILPASIGAVATHTLAPSPVDSTGFMLLVVATGIIVLSTPTFVAGATMLGSSWIVMLALHGEDAGLAFVQVVVPAIAVAFGLQAFRKSAYASMFASHRAERERAEALAVSEARWRGLVENAPITLGIVDRAGKLLFIHYPIPVPEPTPLGSDVAALFPPEHEARVRAKLDEIFTEGHVVTFEAPRHTGSGVRWLTVTGGPLSGAGDSAQAILFAMDDTERRRAAERLSQSERLASLGTLVAGVAHEVNNPLTYIQGSVELAGMDVEEAIALAGSGEAVAPLERTRAHHRVALEGIRRIASLTRALKRVARAHPGERAPVDVNALAGDALAVAKPRLPATCRVELDLAATQRVLASPADLNQVLLNLVLNAADAVAGSESPAVHVRSMDAPDGVVVEVEDNGPGIPESARSRIFTPFHTTKPEGTGLGLAISRRIVEDHGGELSFTSVEGRGACFRMRLPAARPEDASATSAQPM